MKKVISFMAISILLFSITSIKAYADSEPFDIKKAIKVGNDYIKELNISNVYKLIDIGEGTEHAYLNYSVSRSDSINTGSLDNIILKVVKQENDYFVESYQDKANKQVYIDNGNLRIRDEEIGKSQLLITLNNFPKTILENKKNSTIKQDIVNNSISNLCIGLDGKKIAIITEDNNFNYIYVANVEDSKGSKPSNPNEGVDPKLGNILERPVADKLSSYGILKDYEIQKVVFSKDDGELIFQLKKDNNLTVKIYKNPVGDDISSTLENNFPSDKYDVTIDSINQNGNFINVSEKGSDKKIKYDLDIKGKNIDPRLVKDE